MALGEAGGRAAATRMKNVKVKMTEVLMIVRRILIAGVLGCSLVGYSGCSSDSKPAASASAGPSLDAKEAAERAEAAREAAKKYGGTSS